MLRTAKILLLIYGIITLIFGLLMFLIPGRFLGWFGWEPVDPLISRLLGASLLAMSYCSLRGYLAAGVNVVRMLVSGYLIFTALGAVGLLRHLVSAWYPLMVWFVFILLVVWAAVWGVVYVLLGRENQ